MAGNNDIHEREKIAKEIEKTSESIRKKHCALKTGKIEDDIAAKRHFKPIIEPLQKIVDSSGTRTMKDEPEASRDVEIETSSAPKREKNVGKTKKVKQASSDHSLIESPKRHKLNDVAPLTL